MRSASAPITLRQAPCGCGHAPRRRRRRSASGRCRSPRPARRRSRPSCAWRPPAPSRRSGVTGCRASRRSRARRASRRCRRSQSGRPATRPRPCIRTMLSVSPWSVRRSEWPTMTCEAPASFSISAEMSPVCGAAFLPVAVLAAALDRRARQDFGRARQQRGRARKAAPRFRRRDSLMKPWPIASSSCERGAGAVHLPVAGDKRADG